MFLVKNVTLPLDTDFSDIPALVAKALKISRHDIICASLYKKSVDARHKNNIVFCCSFTVNLKSGTQIHSKNVEKFKYKEYVWRTCHSSVRPVVVGFGPAGMFAALTLAKAGLKPIVIERGKAVDERASDVENFFCGGRLDPESNVQFGEGGAGTFSDGKLNTGIKDERCRTVLARFAKAGAGEQILYLAKPHIGTDVLKSIVKNIRNEIVSLGGEIKFSSRLDDIEIKDGTLCSVTINGVETPCGCLVLAIGHSARDTFYMLKSRGIEMERKSFAVGARIEHLQSDINRAMYGDFANHPSLGAADYKLVTHLPSGRAVYTFCMCPGGSVVNASSEAGHITVNGMSNSRRDGENANSALLVEICPRDLDGDDVLEGIRFQRNIEKAAYDIAGGGVPFCYVGDLTGESATAFNVKPTVQPYAVKGNMYKVLPTFVSDSIKQSIRDFDKKISGFGKPDSILTFPEARSSCPVRILRDKEFHSISAKGLYPAGEGAGYAGGITSAAVDGMRVAEQIIKELNIGL